jgi:nitroreductase
MIMSAPALAAIASNYDDRRSQVVVGQVYQRMALLANELGLAIHPLSQILEVPETKRELNEILNVPEAKAEVTGLGPEEEVFPVHTFRLGYAEPERRHTPRRRLEEVLL